MSVLANSTKEKFDTTILFDTFLVSLAFLNEVFSISI